MTYRGLFDELLCLSTFLCSQMSSPHSLHWWQRWSTSISSLDPSKADLDDLSTLFVRSRIMETTNYGLWNSTTTPFDCVDELSAIIRTPPSSSTQGLLEGPVGCLNVKRTQATDTDTSDGGRAENVTVIPQPKILAIWTLCRWIYWTM